MKDDDQKPTPKIGDALKLLRIGDALKPLGSVYKRFEIGSATVNQLGTSVNRSSLKLPEKNESLEELFDYFRNESDRRRQVEDALIEHVTLHKAQAVKSQNETAQANIKINQAKKWKRLKPKQRDHNEGLLLLYEIFEFYKIEYLDQLSAAKAWGKIVAGEFKSDLIKTISEAKTYIILNGGGKLSKEDFCEKYRKRFEFEVE